MDVKRKDILRLQVKSIEGGTEQIRDENKERSFLRSSLILSRPMAEREKHGHVMAALTRLRDFLKIYLRTNWAIFMGGM